MKCLGGCGAEIDEGLYCLACAGEPDKTTYLRAPACGWGGDSFPESPEEPSEYPSDES